MALALQHGLPVASSFSEFTDARALAGYGPPRRDLYRRAAYYVKRILDGAKPADLPVEQPKRIELSSLYRATLNEQLITTLAYNRDRGPVLVFGARLRA